MSATVPHELRDILRRWRPGSQDWDWAQEAADLIARDGEHLSTLVLSIRKDGFRTPRRREEPVMLGDDGRVWSGHHRIVAAILCDVPEIPVTFGSSR